MPRLTTLQRTQIIEAIVAEAEAQAPRVTIVETFDHEGDDGGWYSVALIPWGVRLTGKKRCRGFVFEDADGRRVGRLFATKAQAEQDILDRSASRQAELLSVLETHDDRTLVAQKNYWLGPDWEPTIQR